MKGPQALKVEIRTVMYLKFDELGSIEEVLDKGREAGESEVVSVTPVDEKEYKEWLS